MSPWCAGPLRGPARLAGLSRLSLPGHVVRENLTKAFPDLDEAGLRKIMRAYYDGFAQMLVELLKGATLPPAEISRRVQHPQPRQGAGLPGARAVGAARRGAPV